MEEHGDAAANERRTLCDYGEASLLGLKCPYRATDNVGSWIMKSTESLGVAEPSVDLPSTAGETGLLGDTSTLNNKRRRLIRGAVALAPVVLTLRSGALAAASCTGAKAQNVTLGNGTNGTLDKKIPANITVVDGDVCYKTSDVPTCSAQKVQNLPGPQAAYPVDFATRKCGPSGGRLPGGTNVAILSATAAASLLI